MQVSTLLRQLEAELKIGMVAQPAAVDDDLGECSDGRYCCR